MTDENRWDENAGLQAGCNKFPVMAVTLYARNSRLFFNLFNAALKGSYQDTPEDPDGTKWYIVGYLNFDNAGNGSSIRWSRVPNRSLGSPQVVVGYG